METTFNFKISNNIKERIDVFLSRELSITRNRAQQLIKSGCVLINSRESKPSAITRWNDNIYVALPEIKEVGLIPQEISLDIIFQDDHLMVINKPPGLVVHPARGHQDSTVVNAVLFHCPQMKGINNELRPGIVHRLDKDTYGIMVIAKDEKSHNFLASQIKNRKILKEYLALVRGIPAPEEGTIIAPIGRHPVYRKKMTVIESGREAVTCYKIEKKFNLYSLLKLKLITGRTHQIRVHLSYKGYPIAGDPLYGKQKGVLGLKRQALHATKLGFIHPLTEKWMEFSAPLAEDIKKVLDELEREL